MSSKNKRFHRHFIAAPLFVSLLLATFASGNMQASLVLWDEPEVLTVSDRTMVIMSNGVQISRALDAKVDFSYSVAVLQKGSALVTSEGIARIKTGGVTFTGLNGLFYVTKNDGDISVAALTTPVLVQHGQLRSVVPVGTQWRYDPNIPLISLDSGFEKWVVAREAKPLPHKFLWEQLNNAETFPAPEVSILPRARQEIPVMKMPNILYLDAAQDRLKSTARDALMGVIRYHLERGEYIGIADILEQLDVSDSYVQEVLGILLARTGDRTQLAAPIVRFLGTDTDLGLVLSLHPKWRALAWTFLETPNDREAALLRSLKLPESDFSLEGSSDLTVNQWKQDLTEQLKREDKESFFEVLLPHMEKIINRMRSNSYPERARRFALAVLELADAHSVGLSAKSVARVELLRENLDSVELLPIPEEEVEVIEEPSFAKASDGREDQFSEDQVEALAYAILHNAGALITLETSVEVIDGVSAQMSNIVFSTSSADRKFDFVLNITNREVSELREGDLTFPYALSMDDFLGWVFK